MERIETFLLSLQEKSVNNVEEVGMVWMNLRNDKFSIKSFYSFSCRKGPSPFPVGVNGVFSLESNLWKNIDFDLLQRRRWFLVHGCFLCKEEEYCFLLPHSSLYLLVPFVYVLYTLLSFFIRHCQYRCLQPKNKKK